MPPIPSRVGPTISIAAIRQIIHLISRAIRPLWAGCPSIAHRQILGLVSRCLVKIAGGLSINGFLVHKETNSPFMSLPRVGSGLTSDIFTAFELNRFYHVAVVKTGNSYTFYIDGQQKGTRVITTSVADVAAPLTIGYAEGGIVHNGAIDEVRIYNRALSSNEVSLIYDQTRPQAKKKQRSPEITDSGDSAPVMDDALATPIVWPVVAGRSGKSDWSAAPELVDGDTNTVWVGQGGGMRAGRLRWTSRKVSR